MKEMIVSMWNYSHFLFILCWIIIGTASTFMVAFVHTFLEEDRGGWTRVLAWSIWCTLLGPITPILCIAFLLLIFGIDLIARLYFFVKHKTEGKAIWDFTPKQDYKRR